MPLLVHVRDRRYRLDWESQAAGWFSMIEALSLPLLPGSTRSSPRTATSLTGTDRQRGTGFVEVWRCCLGTEPQVVGVAFRCGGHGELAAYLVRSPCLLRDNCARGRAPERRGRSSAARTIRRILLLVPRAAPAATESPTRGRLRRCSPKTSPLSLILSPKLCVPLGRTWNWPAKRFPLDPLS